MMGTNPARRSLLDLSSALMSLHASRRRRDRIKSVFLGRIYQLILQNVRSSETNTFNASMIRCLKQSRTGFCKIQTHFTHYEKCRYEKEHMTDWKEHMACWNGIINPIERSVLSII